MAWNLTIKSDLRITIDVKANKNKKEYFFHGCRVLVVYVTFLSLNIWNCLTYSAKIHFPRLPVAIGRH